MSTENKKRRPKVMMLGLRGIPHVQGGVEKHVEELSWRFVEQGWDVDVLGRTPYLPATGSYQWKSVRVLPLWSPRSVKFEAIVHTAIGVLYAAFHRPDILHIHAIGPALMTPLARLLGLKVVVTHHGFDYDRQKWNGFAKTILKLGERCGMRFAHGRIAVSNDIATTMNKRYDVAVHFIPNGVSISRGVPDTGILEALELARRKYIIMVARLVPEKRQEDLIAAFGRLTDPSIKLVLVGSADHKANYSRFIEKIAATTPGVVLAGLQTGDDLACLYQNAKLFVLPSSHEGMPIALLEAMAYGLPVLASNITANLEIDLPIDDYFEMGDVEQLTVALQSKLSASTLEEKTTSQNVAVENKYGWNNISEQTRVFYQRILAKTPLS